MVMKKNLSQNPYDDPSKKTIFAHEKQDGLLREDLSAADPNAEDRVFTVHTEDSFVQEQKIRDENRALELATQTMTAAGT